MEQITDLAASLRHLKLSRLADHLGSWLQHAAKGEGVPLQRLADEEIAAKKDKQTEMGTRMARLPFISFDYQLREEGHDHDFEPTLLELGKCLEIRSLQVRSLIGRCTK